MAAAAACGRLILAPRPGHMDVSMVRPPPPPVRTALRRSASRAAAASSRVGGGIITTCQRILVWGATPSVTWPLGCHVIVRCYLAATSVPATVWRARAAAPPVPMLSVC